MEDPTGETMLQMKKRIEELEREIAAVEEETEEDKKKVVELTQKIQTALDCPLCLEPMTSTNYPIVRACGHTCCFECAKHTFDEARMAERGPPVKKNITCLECNDSQHDTLSFQQLISHKNYELMNLQ